METVRDTLRSKQREIRETQRLSMLNRNRDVNVISSDMPVTEYKMHEIAKSCRKKQNMNKQMMSLLQAVFMNQPEHIKIFIREDGALHSLVRGLSGRQLQLEAAYVFVNLSICDAQCSMRIINEAGPYFVSFLDAGNIYLVEACAWVIGNLANDETCAEQLKSQGGFAKLVQLLTSEEPVIVAAATYSLSLFVYNGFDILQVPDFQSLSLRVIHIFEKEVPGSTFLTSLISSNESCCVTLISSKVHLTAAIRMYLLLVPEHVVWSEVTCLLRILSNLIPYLSEGDLTELVTLSYGSSNLIPIMFNKLFHCGVRSVTRETMWFFGNCLNLSNQFLQEVILELFKYGQSAESLGFLQTV